MSPEDESRRDDIVVSCFASDGRRWWLPLAITALAALSLVCMPVMNFVLRNRFGFTIFGIVAVAMLGLYTLAEALVARPRAKRPRQRSDLVFPVYCL